MKKIEFFKVEGNRINRIRKHCPKCGPAVFLAEHKDRFGCGKCGYTEFKGGGRKEPTRQPVEEKPVEQQVSAEVKEEEEKSVVESEQIVEPSTESQQPIIPETPAVKSNDEDKSELTKLEKKQDEKPTGTVKTMDELAEKSATIVEESDEGESKKDKDKSKDPK